MSGYSYGGGGHPQYPPPQNQIYPQIYNPANAPPPQGHPAPAYQIPGQNPQFPYQPYPYGYQQPGQVMPQGHPAAMSYPGAPQPAPSAPGFYPTGAPTIAPTPTFSPTVEWISTTAKDAHMLGDRAVVAGYEGHDNSPLWVIRARFQGDLIPGKMPVKHQTAYVPWGGKENPVQSIEVCCARPEKVRWVPCTGGVIPPNAVLGGNTSDGEPLYIGRAREQGSLTPGKVHPSHQVLYISFAGQEVPHKTYEILCTV